MPSVGNRVISIVWRAWLATLDVLVWSVVPSVHLTTRRVRSDLIETFKIIHDIDRVDKNLFFEFDSGGSRCGPVGSRWGPVGSGGVRWGI